MSSMRLPRLLGYPGVRLGRGRLPAPVIEVLAAAAGAILGIAASGIGGMLRRDNDAASAVVRLTAAVEHIAGEVSLMRGEMREDRTELFGRLGKIEQRVAILEARQ